MKRYIVMALILACIGNEVRAMGEGALRANAERLEGVQ